MTDRNGSGASAMRFGTCGDLRGGRRGWLRRRVMGRVWNGLAAALLAFGLPGCDMTEPIGTVPGPEDPSLLAAMRGRLLAAGPLRPVVAVTLPKLTRQVIRGKSTTESNIVAVSGPDAAGRIVAIENHAQAATHALKLLQLDGGAETVIFERPGDAIWGHAVGKHIALAPTGGRLALVGRHAVMLMHNPDASLSHGPLEVWSIETRAPLPLDRLALDRRLSWFPDGQRLAYTGLATHDVVAAHAPGQGIGGGFAQWPRIPSIMILDVASSASRFVTVGWDPIVSTDGRFILYSDLTGVQREFDLAAGSARPVEWPGDWGGPVAYVGPDLVAYWGLPTAGIPEQREDPDRPLFSPLGRATLKVAHLKTGKFATVLGAIDPRWSVSYGVWKKSD